MKRYQLIEQPPYARKFKFLVDDKNMFGTFGHTVDINKILYNIKLIGDDFRINQELRNLLTKKGLTTVVPLGRFITVLKINKDTTAGEMAFYDFDIEGTLEKENIIKLLRQTYTENVMNEWVKCQKLLIIEFQPIDDIVELFVPVEN